MKFWQKQCTVDNLKSQEKTGCALFLENKFPEKPWRKFKALFHSCLLLDLIIDRELLMGNFTSFSSKGLTLETCYGLQEE